jgi:hypothetical protein
MSNNFERVSDVSRAWSDRKNYTKEPELFGSISNDRFRIVEISILQSLKHMKADFITDG